MRRRLFLFFYLEKKRRRPGETWNWAVSRVSVTFFDSESRELTENQSVDRATHTSV
jgi:hypothetical protein